MCATVTLSGRSFGLRERDRERGSEAVFVESSAPDDPRLYRLDDACLVSLLFSRHIPPRQITNLEIDQAER